MIRECVYNLYWSTFDAVAVCICTEIKPMHRHNCGNSRIRLSEPSASAARFKRIQRIERVKYIANMWISWTGLRRVVHKLSTSVTIFWMIFDCHLEYCHCDIWTSIHREHLATSTREFDFASHWCPHPLPLKWIGNDVHTLSIVIKQYGHPGGVISELKSALTPLMSLHTGHLNS